MYIISGNSVQKDSLLVASIGEFIIILGYYFKLFHIYLSNCIWMFTCFNCSSYNGYTDL